MSKPNNSAKKGSTKAETAAGSSQGNKGPRMDLESVSASEIKQWIARDVADNATDQLVTWAKKKVAIFVFIFSALGVASYLEIQNKISDEVEKEVPKAVEAHVPELNEMSKRAVEVHAETIVQFREQSRTQEMLLEAETKKAIADIIFQKQNVEAEAQSTIRALTILLASTKEIAQMSADAGDPNVIKGILAEDSANIKRASKTVSDSPTSNFDAYQLSANCYYFALLSMIAYSDPTTQTNVLSDLGLTAIRCFTHDDVRGFVASNEKVVIVAFAMNEDFGKILSDANVMQRSFTFGFVNSGFYNAFDGISNILGYVAQQRTSQQHLFVTGHGAGGALAVLAAARLNSNSPVSGVFSFGSPRVGDPEFVDQFNVKMGSDAWRLWNYGDTVTRIPPRVIAIPPSFYDHAGVSLMVGAEGQLTNDESAWNEFLLNADEMERINSQLQPAQDLKAHSISTYVDRLRIGFSMQPNESDAK
jgi:triacylglycerol lipase